MATLGAVQVDRDELQRQLQALPPQARAQLRTIARAWINGCAPGSPRGLDRTGAVQGWQDKPEVKRAFQAAQEQILMQSYLESVSRAPDDYPTEADLASAYEARQAAVGPARAVPRQPDLPAGPAG